MMKFPPVTLDHSVSSNQVKSKIALAMRCLSGITHQEIFLSFDGRFKVCRRDCALINLMSNFVILDPERR